MSWPGLVGGVLLEAVIVRGAGTCPSPSDVRARLEPLVRTSSGRADVADVVRRGAIVSVSLARSDGRPIGTQTLEGTACADLADAAAVILATWENDEAQARGLSLPSAPVERDVPRSSEVRSSVPPAGSPGRTWDVALGAGASLAEGALSPAVMASGSLAPSGGIFGLRIAGGLAGRGTVVLPDGRVQWTRLALGGGPKAAWATAGLSGEAHLGAYAGWVRSEGEGFSSNRDDDGLELALAGSLRLGVAGSGFRPWIEGSVVFFPSPVSAYQLPASESVRLPGLAVLVLGGFLLGR